MLTWEEVALACTGPLLQPLELWLLAQSGKVQYRGMGRVRAEAGMGVYRVPGEGGAGLAETSQRPANISAGES